MLLRERPLISLGIGRREGGKSAKGKRRRKD